jgi:hypothetical protein
MWTPEVNQYVKLTKDIPELNLPKDTLGIITRVFTPIERKENDPYSMVIQTLTEPDVAVSFDEVLPCQVEGERYAD